MKKLKVVFMDGIEKVYECERYWHQPDKGILGYKKDGVWHSIPDRNVREYVDVTYGSASATPKEDF